MGKLSWVIIAGIYIANSRSINNSNNQKKKNENKNNTTTNNNNDNNSTKYALASNHGWKVWEGTGWE